MLDLSDSHTHLEDYGPQLPEVVQRARDVGVRRIITAGSSLESSKAAVRIAEEYPDIYAGVGIHPHAAHLNITEATFDELRSLAKSSEKVVMICEPGLDYFKSKAPREVQQDVFRQHLRMARDLSLPVVFHSREAYWDCLRILKEERVYEVGGIMHYFVADQRIAEECMDMGIYVSFSKTILSLHHLHPIAKSLPIEYMVIETDSFPQPWRKKNPLEPAQLLRVAEKIAELRGITVEEVASHTTANLKYVVGPKLL